MSETKLPDKARPTNSDLMNAMREVHECVHVGAQKTDALAKTVAEDRRITTTAIGKIEKQVSGSMAAAQDTRERLASVEGSLAVILRSLGVKPATEDAPLKSVQRFGSQHPAVVVGQVFGACASAIATMKFALPPALAFATSLWAQISAH